jgi:hypothetical protein
MTLGGYIPYSEDDLGGLWAADLRSHVSVYGGFFSNVGLVRKQFLGGSLLGVGVYWDYDGDLNQYPNWGMLGTDQFGQFGHAYNQVGVSGEWLTDFGNLRSNGYMPVGTTAYTAGAPGSHFYQNYVMCQHGLDAALSGADLEVGAYIPGLSDWAGMISVGGYALGNARYNWWQGPQTGKDVVPWFGGVYTRLDATFLENWDFSLQANNDSFFDWTGFARLTYRMGGSRRRNVPDQMEQPMMRNEHIVRAHQTPIVALNPATGTPWRVIHVNNAALPGGDGSAERPFNQLVQADAAATNPWDIVFVGRGDGTARGYDTTFSFNAPNQYLVGDGAPFGIPTLTCGLKDIAVNTSGLVPLLSNPAGTSVLINGAVAGGATVSNFQITGSDVGIAATGNLTGPPSPTHPGGTPTIVNNVTIASDGTTAGQSGVAITNATGQILFTETSISDMTRNGLLVEGGSPVVVYQGSIANATPGNGPVLEVRDTAGAVVQVALGSPTGSSTVPNQVVDTGGEGIRISGNSSSTAIDVDNVSLTDNVNAAIAVINDSSTTAITSGLGSGIVKSTPGAAISVEGGMPNFDYFGPIANNPAAASPASFLANVSDLTGGNVRILPLPGAPFQDTGDGIQILNNANATVTIGPATVTSRSAQGVLIDGNSGSTIALTGLTVTGTSSAGVLATNSATSTLEFRNLNINLAGENAVGFLASKVGSISTSFTNSIVTSSTTQPAVSITNSGPLSMTFNQISSGVAAGTNAAMEFLGTTPGTPGTFRVTSSFQVGGAPGTAAADVTNTGGVTLTLPPP